MFEPNTPRLFGLAPGVDFPRALAAGLLARCAGQPPETLARVTVYVNTRRMQRRLVELFEAGPALLLPRIRLVSEIGQDIAIPGLLPAVSPLRRRLEMSQLVAQLLQKTPDLAPRAAIYDLADSLAGLMDEMQGEGVAPQAIRDLDVSDQSGHWQRSLTFVQIIERYFGSDSSEPPDLETRQRRVITHLAETWKTVPPLDPVIVAGSTGSRGATALFMQAVAGLPQGAIVFPGFDFDMPHGVWDTLEDALTAEDHPQFRAKRMMDMLGLDPGDVQVWQGGGAPVPARNKLVSLALRPAPVTDQWMTEGPTLRDLPQATEAMGLIEAPSPRIEALAIALCLHDAAETGQTAALITPDRTLTRQVTAALDRWGIEPDDSAGRPLSLSPPGRLLRQIAALFGQKMSAEALLAVLKHPLTHTGADRGPHLRFTRELELWLRRRGPAFPERAQLTEWSEENLPDAMGWVGWIADLQDRAKVVQTQAIADHVDLHITLAEQIAAGAQTDGSGALWEAEAGAKARDAVEDLRTNASFGGTMAPGEYAELFRAILDRSEVRDPNRPHPRVMIWGTLEARVQGADLTILAGLNDGTWPEPPPIDPWLNRAMRVQAGLLLPERRIGLSAHDFQQAIAAPKVVLSRSIRTEEAETVPSRWINRLTNLLGGLPDQGGRDAVADMQARGQTWIAMAQALEAVPEPVPAATRPSPRPPAAQRLKKLSVTQIRTLIRDPYAIYAREVLRLRKLDPLRQAADAPLRGTVIHKILEDFIKTWSDPGDRQVRLMEITDRVLTREIPWPAARRIWRARLARIAPWFIDGEVQRAASAQVLALEGSGGMVVEPYDFTLTVKADRIDAGDDGQLRIYDYKTGAPPSQKAQKSFDKQLLLTAALAERGAFKGLRPAPVLTAAYIGLGTNPKVEDAPLLEMPPAQTWAELSDLIAKYLDPDQGFTARRALHKDSDPSDYDHLSRFGEWTVSDDPVPEDMA